MVVVPICALHQVNAELVDVGFTDPSISAPELGGPLRHLEVVPPQDISNSDAVQLQRRISITVLKIGM